MKMVARRKRVKRSLAVASERSHYDPSFLVTKILPLLRGKGGGKDYKNIGGCGGYGSGGGGSYGSSGGGGGYGSSGGGNSYGSMGNSGYGSSGGGSYGSSMQDFDVKHFVDPFAKTLVAGHSVLSAITTGLFVAGVIAKLANTNIHIIPAHHVRKRSSGDGNKSILRQNNIFFEALSFIDQDDCIAKAVCHASTPDQRTAVRNEKLLNAFGILESYPMPRKDLNDVRGKYRYAAFVGSAQNQPEREESCESAFHRCHLPGEEVLELMTMNENSCDTLLSSLERFLPKNLWNQNRSGQSNQKSKRAKRNSKKKRPKT